jgi:hypothetical protein
MSPLIKNEIESIIAMQRDVMVGGDYPIEFNNYGAMACVMEEEYGEELAQAIAKAVFHKVDAFALEMGYHTVTTLHGQGQTKCCIMGPDGIQIATMVYSDDCEIQESIVMQGLAAKYKKLIIL